MNDLAHQSVLVVEDSAMQRSHLVGLVRLVGFGEVLEAEDGEQALSILQGRRANPLFLMVTDLDMPGMDGIELTRHLSGSDLVENIIVTSACDPRLLEVVESMGAEDTKPRMLGSLYKPVLLDDLALMLTRLDDPQRSTPGTTDRGAFTLAQLRDALERKEFLPYFQPKVAIASGLVKGVEALARWQHPEHGIVSPLHFIPRLEGTDLMAPFTLSLVERVIGHLATWRRFGLSITVSVNLSADNLADRAFIDALTALTERLGVAPEALTWEVTEAMVMNNLAPCLANMARLRLKGFGLAMDDYGVGYSSLQQLSRCPFTELKVERNFVNGASEQPNRRVTLEGSIEMGHRLAAATVAEGVETLPDWHLLRELGCDMAQGYLIAMPMPGEDIAPWIKANRTRLKSLAASEA